MLSPGARTSGLTVRSAAGPKDELKATNPPSSRRIANSSSVHSIEAGPAAIVVSSFLASAYLIWMTGSFGPGLPSAILKSGAIESDSS